MPYIHPDRRVALSANPEEIPMTAGEFNYRVTILMKDLLGSDPNYTTINEAIGVLECAKLELYRRVAVPYEDQKKFDNGDVYD